MEIACLFIFWNLAALDFKHFVTNLKAKNLLPSLQLEFLVAGIKEKY